MTSTKIPTPQNRTPMETEKLVDALAQEIRRVDGNHSLGAGAVNVGVAVKALEWRSQGSTWIAETPFGGHQMDVDPWVGGPAIHLLHGDSFLSPHGSIEEAKAAAQADYERRILSAIVQSDQTQVETPSPQNHVAGLPQDVINLVMAAREAFDSWMLAECESNALDKALEPFAERVPYQNEPADAEGSAE